MTRHLLLVPFLSAAFVASASADEIFSLKFGFAYIEPEGTFSGDDGVTSTEINFKDDLDFEASRGLVAEVALQGGRFWLSATYLPMDFSSSGTANRDIVFRGRVFTVGTDVRSDVTIDFLDFGLAYHILDFDYGSLRIQLGPEVAVKYANIEMFIEEIRGIESESVSATEVAPTIGVRIRGSIGDFLSVVGRIGYFEHDDESLLDAEIQTEYSPLPMLGVFVGYRYIDVDLHDSGATLDSTFSGPYVGAVARF